MALHRKKVFGDDLKIVNIWNINDLAINKSPAHKAGLDTLKIKTIRLKISFCG
jgi:hypothetical protein